MKCSPLNSFNETLFDKRHSQLKFIDDDFHDLPSYWLSHYHKSFMQIDRNRSSLKMVITLHCNTSNNTLHVSHAVNGFWENVLFSHTICRGSCPYGVYFSWLLQNGHPNRCFVYCMYCVCAFVSFLWVNRFNNLLHHWLLITSMSAFSSIQCAQTNTHNSHLFLLFSMYSLHLGSVCICIHLQWTVTKQVRLWFKEVEEKCKKNLPSTCWLVCVCVCA